VEAPAALWPWMCNAASSVAPASRVTAWNVKLLEPSSLTVPAKLTLRNAMWSDLVKVIPGRVTLSPSAVSMNTKSVKVRPEIDSLL